MRSPGRTNQLIFLSNTTFMVATVSTLPEPHADTPRPIVDEPLLVGGSEAVRPYDVAPDGRILAIKEDDSVRSDHIVVVQNWLSEVRAPIKGRARRRELSPRVRDVSRRPRCAPGRLASSALKTCPALVQDKVEYACFLAHFGQKHECA